MNNLEEIKKEIIKTLKPLDPERVVLFGSYVNGTANENSDIDLYVVTKDDYIPQNFKEKMNIKLKVAHLIDSIRDKFPVDTIVHTKKMAELFKTQNSDFYKEINSKGMVLI